MMHNTNLRNGRADPIDVVDDDVSEISSVSQTKDTLRRQLKSVPFRQHKVTMLLQSLFTECTSTKVTLLLAAYPGHADYTEKRILLQDLELLCGTALISSRKSAATGLKVHESRPARIPFSDSRSTLSHTSSRDEETNFENRSSGNFNNNDSRFRSASCSSVSLTLSASVDENDENFHKPSPYAPHYVRERDMTLGRPVSATAPVMDVPEAMSTQRLASGMPVPHQNPKYVSDFPGVELPAKKELCDPFMERTRVTTISSSCQVGEEMRLCPMNWRPRRS